MGSWSNGVMSWNATPVNPSLHYSFFPKARHSLALPLTLRVLRLLLLDFSGQQPAKVGESVEVTENLDVEILVVVY